MKKTAAFVMILLSSIMLLSFLSGCSAAATQLAPQADVFSEAMEEPREEMSAEEPASAPPSQAESEPQAQDNEQVASSPNEFVNRPNRLIIKDGQMILVVDNTDVAIDRVTQIVADMGGYFISSRTFFEENLGVNQKLATLTVGIPVDNFEKTLLRLRQIAVEVVNEESTGQDVTDEYVDQKSRLESLEATRARILQFMDEAQTVEEALKVNDQLAEVEAEIEQVKGRLNYLFDRASYSTITI